MEEWADVEDGVGWVGWAVEIGGEVGRWVWGGAVGGVEEDGDGALEQELGEKERRLRRSVNDSNGLNMLVVRRVWQETSSERLQGSGIAHLRP